MGRQGFHNVRHVLNILYNQKGKRDMVLLSLDSEKAFDRVELLYLFDITARFGFGQTFRNLIKLFHLNPIAEVLTNEVVSSPFNITRGCPQGSHLLPLFVLAIEPIALAIRANRQIQVIRIGNRDHKIAPIHLHISISALLELLHQSFALHLILDKRL